MIDQMRASIMKTFYELNPIMLYDDEVPDNLKTPSAFFPTPFTTGGIYSKDDYEQQFSMNVAVFHLKSNEAINMANSFVEYVLARKSRIYLYSVAGTLTEDYLQVKEMNVNKIDDGVAQLQIIWTVANKFI